MAYHSFPTTAYNNRALTPIEYEQLVWPVGRNGLTGTPDTDPVFADSTGRHVKIRASVGALIRGVRWRNFSETLVQVPANSSGSTRIDLLVLRMNRGAAAPNAFTLHPVIIQGIPAASPVAPTAVRSTDDTGVWDIPLCEIVVPSGAVTITAAQVTNRAWWITASGYTGTSTTRPPIEPGLLWREWDTGITYIGTGGGNWQRVASNSGWKSLALPSGWTGSVDYIRLTDTVHISIATRRTGGDLANTATVDLGPLPEGFRPARQQFGTYHCSYPDHSSHMYVGTDGVIHMVGTSNGDGIANGSYLFANLALVAAPTY